MASKIKIAFAGNYNYNCGSSNMLLHYVQAGDSLGFDVRVSEYSLMDDIVRSSLPIADRHWQPDLFIIVYETYPFLSPKDVDEICKRIPRSKRIVLDPDGKYSKPVSYGGDTNHPTKNSYKEWTELCDLFSDTILQPILGKSDIPNVRSFLYFGITNKGPIKPDTNKEFDLVYVGTNWYRWKDICGLIKTVSSIRPRLQKIALIGQFWNGETMEGYLEATFSDPKFLKDNQIEVYGPAKYGEVETAMSRGP